MNKLGILTALVLATACASPNAADPDTADIDTAGERLMLTDFTADTTDLRWYVQNDNVMGGRSEGGFDVADGELVFAGSTNTRGGGFSSIRSGRMQLDLSAYDGVRLRVKSDGRRYTWQLQTSARSRGFRVSYWAEFQTTEEGWTTVDVPFADFYPQIRGFKLKGPVLDTSDITEMGLYIYDGLDGPFELRIDSIDVYKNN